MSKTKVLFCTDGIFPHSVGGIQRHSQLLLSALAQRGQVELTVVHPHRGQTLFEQFPEVKEIVLDLPSSNKNYLLQLYAYSRQVAEVARKHPDHVLYAQGVTVWHSIRSLGSRVIFNPHGLEPFQPLTFKDRVKGFPYSLIYGYIFKHAAKVVALGGKLTSILKERVPRPEDQVVVLPNATLLPDKSEVPTRFQTQTRRIRCLFLGRFASNKGITYLLDAAEELARNGRSQEVHFTLAGKGPLYQELLEKGKNLSHVDMPGFVADEDLPELFRTHDIFILPTLMEGMPTVVLEAMAHGMPIIVTDVGATRELVDEQNGYIIEKKSAKAILEALDQFSHSELAQKQAMARASQARVASKFVWDIVAKQHEEVFVSMHKQIIGSESGRIYSSERIQ